MDLKGHFEITMDLKGHFVKYSLFEALKGRHYKDLGLKRTNNLFSLLVGLEI